MDYRSATPADARLLAALNLALIRDEGHRNRMTLPELETRMSGWLVSDYRAIVFEEPSGPAGYALFRDEPDHIYLRQFYVKPERRREGVGHNAVEWLRANLWRDAMRIRLDVLVGNEPAIAFWRAVGFADYCLTMELEQHPPQ